MATMMGDDRPVPAAEDDPPPEPPPRPDPDDCCRSACSPCIFDVYEDALERYRIELERWEARHTTKLPKR